MQDLIIWSQLEQDSKALRFRSSAERCGVAVSQDGSLDEFEFGRHAAASSKDNFIAWMVEQVETFHLRFNWSVEEVETIVGMLLIARDMAIDDVGATLAEVTKLDGSGPETHR
ncbi:MAG TPA: hypothetical protein VFY29_07945 [Terriglobia bacterium]|nr:hypothetical protein [Terriglobia bacterium]